MNSRLPNDSSRIRAAMENVRQGAARLSRDDAPRPAYHFRAPALRMNDPQPLFHNGWYHMFYQYSPYEEKAWKHWAHARSRDMLHWEYLPIALSPASELGERSCWSGCVTIRDDGRPMILYSSIGEGKSPGSLNNFDGAQQWAALGDAELITWERVCQNPVLSDDRIDGKKIYDWRDPYLIRWQDKTYMLLGGNQDGRKPGGGVAVLYQAQNGTLTQWSAGSIIYECPENDVIQMDCPNLFQVGEQWVLLFSPWRGSIRYVVGEMDFAEPRFHPRRTGFFDLGPDLFATNTMTTADGRLVVWAWVRGFYRALGWSGCLAVPRTVALNPDGRLVQEPVKEIETLRQTPVVRSSFEVRGTQIVPNLHCECLDMEWLIEVGEAERCGLRFFCDASGHGGCEILLENRILGLLGIPLLSERKWPGHTIELRILVDRSVIEVFLDGGIHCLTRVYYPKPEEIHVAVFAEGGNMHVRSSRAWPLQTDGLFSCADR